MIPLLTASEMVDLEQRAIANWGISPLILQEHAAMGALNLIPKGELIQVLAGPGNNGGDALALARLAKLQGRKVQVWVLNEEPIWKDSAAIQAKLWEGLGGNYNYTDKPDKIVNSFYGWVVDGLFGIGVKLPIRGLAKAWIKALQEVSRQKRNFKILALDLPSGLDPNSPDVTEVAFGADLTACFGCLKICHGLRPALDYCGDINLIPIPINNKPKSDVKLLECPDSLFFNSWNTNKRDLGHVCIRAGSMGMSGAAVMSALGALHMGAGLVTIMPEDSVRAEVAVQVPEAMVKSWNNRLPDNIDVLLVGPGGITEVPIWDGPLVLDASALRVGEGRQWMARSQTVITPHQGEFNRLFNSNCVFKTSDRLLIAKEVATGPGILVIKGAQSIIAGGNSKEVWLNPTGHNGLSTGGTGDFLAGMVAAQVAKWKKRLDHNLIKFDDGSLKLAASSAVWLHGAIADRLGQAPLLVRELGPSLSQLLRELSINAITK